MEQNLLDLRAKGVIVAAHRGTSGGNIVQNTTLAYKNSLLHQADMVEVDVTMSKDGVFYAFHDGQEALVFGKQLDIRQLNAAEIDALPCINSLGEVVEQRLERVSNVLDNLKDTCFINVDRSWFYWNTFLKELKASTILPRILLKSPAQKALLDQLVEANINVMYMPIIKTVEELELALSYSNLNIVALELVFESLDSPLLDEARIANLKKQGYLLWCNALRLNDETILSGGIDDQLALEKGPEASWGRLIAMGFDIIQTDWPMPLKAYINSIQ
ncbi:MAG: glycerophosphodiester phosphodiesterase family protein [Aerococcaceae bacterium]|nr:glycerophosphodiester phosphodiesterase family protein [Aerococcaceae bacterium]